MCVPSEQPGLGGWAWPQGKAATRSPGHMADPAHVALPLQSEHRPTMGWGVQDSLAPLLPYVQRGLQGSGHKKGTYKLLVGLPGSCLTLPGQSCRVHRIKSHQPVQEQANNVSINLLLCCSSLVARCGHNRPSEAL